MIELLNKVHHGDFLDNKLPDKSVKLIIADPPYFEVKGEFDFIWESFDDYLKDVEKWAVECKRILADNGSLFWYGDRKKIAYTQIILDKYFNLESSIVWHVYDKQTNKIRPQDSRAFINVTERILFYSNEIGMTGREFIEEEYIKPKNPFSIYLKSELKRANVTIGEIAKLFPSKTGGMTGCVSNWLNGDNVITKEQYLKIRKYLNNEFLRTEYEDLRTEYEDLRRPFNPLEKNKTDILKFSQEGHISGLYDHDTIKPEKLTEALITTTTRKGDLVFIPFAGSGTECAMSAKTGRPFIGFDIEERHVNTANKRCKLHLDQGQLF